jgi:hypothetical protein
MFGRVRIRRRRDDAPAARSGWPPGSPGHRGVARVPWRLLLVSLIATGGFAAAVAHFGDDYLQACDAPAQPSSTYTATVRVETGARDDVIRVTIGRDSRPVEGARVCLALHRADKPWVAVSGEGRKAIYPGTYELALPLRGGGHWLGRLVVFDGRADPVAVPISFTVTRRLAPSTSAHATG